MIDDKSIDYLDFIKYIWIMYTVLFSSSSPYSNMHYSDCDVWCENDMTNLQITKDLIMLNY